MNETQNNKLWGPTSFSIEGNELDLATFEAAKKANRACEEHWFSVGKKLGGWIPTRELTMGAYRLIDDISYDLERKLRVVRIIVAAEGIAIAGLGLLLAAKLL